MDGGAGMDTVDYSDAKSGVVVDLTSSSAQNTGGGGIDTLTAIEKVVGSDFDDTFSFGSPDDGMTFTVDGGGGTNTVDLTNFSLSDASLNPRLGTVSLSLDDGGSFTVEYHNVAYLEFSDTSIRLDDLLADAGPDQVVNEGDHVVLDATGSNTSDYVESHTEILQLLSEGGEVGDFQGYSVSVDGDLAAVGAHLADGSGEDSGSVTIFQKVDSTWTEIARLEASDGDAGDYFGSSVALSGNTLIVGAMGDEEGGTYSGSAYIFQDTGSGWHEVAKLTADDAQPADVFGESVSISGSTAMVGAARSDSAGTDSGSVYVFEDTGDGWDQVAKLTASDAEEGDWFGRAVSVSDSTAIVGAFRADSSAGSAYIFSRDGGEWTELAKLTPDDAAADSYFGLSVAVSGDTAVVGAPLKDGTGVAYIFQGSDGDWRQVAKLTPSDGEEKDQFGVSVEIDGDHVVIGAFLNDEGGTDAGAAYIFKETSTGWYEVDKLLSSTSTDRDLFGMDVDVSGDTALIGVPGASTSGETTGSAILFETDSDELTYSWTQTGGPEVTLSDPTSAMPTFTAPDVTKSTELTFLVEVSDGTSTSVDTVTIAVQDTVTP